jgi:hypothetical protein
VGRSYPSRAAELRAEREARRRLEEQERIDQPCVEVAARISMAIIDEINRIVVRPGPHAEERECYQMAQEIRDNDERLTELVTEILRVAIRERQFEVSDVSS